ncbi:Uncharacterized protein PODLI_1B003901 [Podarcis lilfordi]|uniref:snRNA-activating protein complex subunit 2 n=1 Tax=Podarcis lilfordi TaxID=74358 RepID=A0AA35KFJ2_9SAUR|nr:Uncharacterized protein PODLI_1B003901 [Podarcis lilfordi]
MRLLRNLELLLPAEDAAKVAYASDYFWSSAAPVRAFFTSSDCDNLEATVFRKLGGVVFEVRTTGSAMKPPSRQRSAPARYRTAPTSQAWTDPEKRRLLRALRAHGQGPLRPELLKKYLPSRDEEEIMAFVEHLKERVAKEAVKEQYQYRQRKQKDAPIPAPIEIWTELAEKLTGPLEDAIATAFSQVWTIASTEPLTLLHSVPPKSVVIKNSQCSSQNLHSESRKSNEESHEPTVSSDVEEIAPTENSRFHVDFEKIYKYLSVISRGCKAPELPPGESAVVLDLLLSLPEELGFLDFKKLKSHMHKCYTELNTHYTGSSLEL